MTSPMHSVVVQGGFVKGVSPEDLSPLEDVPATPAAQVAEIVARARVAQAAWAALGAPERARMLMVVRDRFMGAAERIVDVVHRELGKPEAEAFTSEVVPNDDAFKYWCTKGVKLLANEKVGLNPILFPGKKSWIEQVPRGVVAIITPWNYPFLIALKNVLPALVAGNAVVLKPSEYSARSGVLLAEIFSTLPPGVFNVVQGAGDVGAALLGAGVDMINFTGSTATGRKIAVAAAEKLIPVSLELGSKDAAIVLEDADLDRAANGVVWGSVLNAGQDCSSIERIIVVERVAEEFKRRVVENVKKLRVGPAGAGEVDVGPLSTSAQLSIVKGQLEDARAKGVKFLHEGGPTGKGLHVAPAVFEVPAGVELKAWREETFGPLLPIRVVKDEEEAVRVANDTDYGLTTSIWTRDLARGTRLARRMECGVVTVNNHSFTGSIPMAPWSGVKNSGSGITSSPWALKSFVRPRYVLLDSSRDKAELWWHPYDSLLLAIGRALVTMATRGAPGKLKAILSVIRGRPHRVKGLLAK